MGDCMHVLTEKLREKPTRPVEMAPVSTVVSLYLDKLVKLHQMDNKIYKANIWERFTTVRTTERDNTVRFLKTFSTILLKAQIANFKLSEENKAAHFLWALSVTYKSTNSVSGGH